MSKKNQIGIDCDAYGNFTADPKISNISHLGYDISLDSPIIDIGDNINNSNFLDFVGNKRIFDSNKDGIATIDLGPIEYLSEKPVFDNIEIYKNLFNQESDKEGIKFYPLNSNWIIENEKLKTNTPRGSNCELALQPINLPLIQTIKLNIDFMLKNAKDDFKQNINTVQEDGNISLFISCLDDDQDFYGSVGRKSISYGTWNNYEFDLTPYSGKLVCLIFTIQADSNKTIYFDNLFVTGQVLSSLEEETYTKNQSNIYSDRINVSEIAEAYSNFKITIHNQVGELCLFENNQSEINIEYLTNGVYFLTIADESGKTTRIKFMKI